MDQEIKYTIWKWKRKTRIFKEDSQGFFSVGNISVVAVVAQSCLILCDPMDCSMPGFPAYHLPEFSETHVHCISDAIQTSHPLLPIFSYLLSFPLSGSFPNCWLLTSGGQSTELQLQHQSFQWIFRIDFLWDWLGLISLLSKKLSRVFSSTTVWRHKSFGAQPFLLFSSHIHTWLLEKP